MFKTVYVGIRTGYFHFCMILDIIEPRECLARFSFEKNLQRALVNVSNGLLELQFLFCFCRSFDRSIALSVDRSLDRSLDRSIARSPARSLDRSLDRSRDHSFDARTLESTNAPTCTRSLQTRQSTHTVACKRPAHTM